MLVAMNVVVSLTKGIEIETVPGKALYNATDKFDLAAPHA